MEYAQLVEQLSKEGTYYERQAGLTVTDWFNILDEEDLKLFGRTTSDGQTTLIILYKTNRVNDNFNFWIASEEQLKLFPKIKDIYEEIDTANREIWKNDIL